MIESNDSSTTTYHNRRDRKTYNGTFFVLHIPKCAGTSFVNDLKHMFPSYKIYAKETCFNFMLRLISNEKEYHNITDKIVYNFTMLRSPVAHVYSQFLECKYDEWGKTQTAKTDFPRDSSDLVGLEKWIDRYHANWTIKDKDFNCYNPFNMQARAMTCIEGTNHRIRKTNHPLIIDPRHPQIDMAIANAEKFTFIGIVEYYKLSLCALMFQMVGWMVDGCFCQPSAPVNVSVSRSMTSASSPKRAGSPRFGAAPQIKLFNITHKTPYHSINDLSAETLAKIKRITTIDQQLYDRYVARLIAQVGEIEAGLGEKKMMNCK